MHINHHSNYIKTATLSHFTSQLHALFSILSSDCRLPSTFADGHVLMVLGPLLSTFTDSWCGKANVCMTARQKQFSRDHVWPGRLKPGWQIHSWFSYDSVVDHRADNQSSVSCAVMLTGIASYHTGHPRCKLLGRLIKHLHTGARMGFDTVQPVVGRDESCLRHPYMKTFTNYTKNNDN